MIPHTDILKVSDEDLEWLIEGHSKRARISAWLENGPSIVIVTKGDKGVEAHTKTGTVTLGAQKVDVVDTIGAGDSFNAGFLAALKRSDSLSKKTVCDLPAQVLLEALTFATHVSAHTVSKAGAQPPWLSELKTESKSRQMSDLT